MEMVEKLSRLWIVNVISFFLFSLLIVTGLINWLVLPRGYGQARVSWFHLDIPC